MAKPLRIVSLGSSFAAGPGLGDRAGPRAAGRSGKNYAHLLASSLSISLTDLSVSGATLDNVLNAPQRVFGTEFPAQLSELPAETDVVTLTGGGNDISYIGDIIKDCLNASTAGSILARLSGLSAVPSITPASACEQVTGKLISIIDEIHARAPGAKIYLVEYLTLFGADAEKWTDAALSEDQLEAHKAIAKALQDAYRKAQEARPSLCEVVEMGELSWDHGLGSQDPWVTGWGFTLFLGPAPLHPNEAGMKAVANVLRQRINLKTEIRDT